MTQFFIVSTYDKITAEILASLINIHPDIECKVNPNRGLYIDGINTTLDNFINQNKSKTKKISVSIRSTTSYDILNRIITERSHQLFKKVNITLSPISRIRLLMYSWLQTGQPIERIVDQLNQELIKSGITTGILRQYHMNYNYLHMATIVKNGIEEYYKVKKTDPNYSGPLAKLLPITTPYGLLFLHALVHVYSFDTADLVMTGRQYQFEQLVSNENEFVDLLKYLTNDSVEWTDQLKYEYKRILEEANKVINKVFELPWHDWQEMLAFNIITSKFNLCYSIHSQPLISLYRQAGYAFAQNQQNYSKILSIQLNSCRPAQLYAYFNNIEETADLPQEIEILVNIDQGDDAMKSFLESEIPKRKFTIKYIQSPKPKSYFDLWKPLNELLKITDPNTYFVTNVSDEMVFTTKGWDTILKKYINFFPDDIFRLRLSRNKYRNYYDRWECNFAQDAIPITTKKWLDIVGDWNPCFGPDSFQQLVAFYLAKEDQFISNHYSRDIPINDIQLATDIPELGITEEKRWLHRKKSIEAMLHCQSYKIQLEAKRRAMLLKANIFIHDHFINNYEIRTNTKKKKIEVYAENNLLTSISYKLSWVKITMTNQWRKLYLGDYFCTIIPRSNNVLKNIMMYLVHTNHLCSKVYFYFHHWWNDKLRSSGRS